MVEYLIDKPHGIDLASLHRLFREADQVTLLVHLTGKEPYGVEVSEDDTTAHGKEGIRKPVPVTGLAGYVKLYRHIIYPFHTTVSSLFERSGSGVFSGSGARKCGTTDHSSRLLPTCVQELFR